MPIHTLNGLNYHVVEYGAGPEAVVLLHGFTGSSASWDAIAAQLAARYHVLAPDLPGHGATDAPTDPTRYRIEQATADLIALLDARGIASAHWVGYSMGARLALHVALTHPQRAVTLTLESGSPGLATQAEREARVAADAALANRIENDGVQAFVAFWESLPLFASQSALTDAVRLTLRAARLRNSPVGLANSLRGMGTGAQPSGWDALAAFDRPTHLIVGALDAKFVDIAARMQKRLPQAVTTVVPAAGHAVHLEQPGAFLAALFAGLEH